MMYLDRKDWEKLLGKLIIIHLYSGSKYEGIFTGIDESNKRLYVKNIQIFDKNDYIRCCPKWLNKRSWKLGKIERIEEDII